MIERLKKLKVCSQIFWSLFFGKKTNPATVTATRYCRPPINRLNFKIHVNDSDTNVKKKITLSHHNLITILYSSKQIIR